MSILYVNPATGNDGNSGASTAPFKTISRALQNVPSGTTIQLAAGTYNSTNGEVFPLTVPSGVALVGNEGNKGQGITINGGGNYISPTFAGQNITLRLNTNSQLRGVTVTNPLSRGTAVWIESAAPVIANNTFTQSKREGVFATGSANPLIQGNVFRLNDANGISMAKNSKGEVRSNVCEQTGYGIAVSDDAAPVIISNRISNNRAGIVASNRSRPVLRQNVIENNTEDGLTVISQSVPDLGSAQDPGGNTFQGNGGYDLQNATSTTLVSAGNQLNPNRVKGLIDFIASEVITPPPTPTPTPTPTPPPTPTPTPTPTPVQLRDVAGHWAQEFIETLVSKGVISGFPDGTFRPNNNLTRAEYAALLAKAFNLPFKRPAIAFLDISSRFWGAAAIAKTSRMGFLSGYPDGTFRPSRNLTRTEAIVALISGLELTGGDSSALFVFRDRTYIPNYATTKVATATVKGMIVNYPDLGLLNPRRDITRAEMAAILYQSLVATGEADPINSRYIVPGTGSSSSTTDSFTDLVGHWAGPFVNGLLEQDLISGFQDGTFQPDSPINRAQYAALLVKVFNPQPKRDAVNFKDVPADFWAADAIQQAYRGGFLSGVSADTFNPSANVKRSDVLVSLVNGLDLGVGDSAALSIFEDRDQIPSYAQGAISRALQKLIVVNYPNVNRLRPNDEATRAETAAMIYQALVDAGRVSAITSSQVAST